MSLSHTRRAAHPIHGQGGGDVVEPARTVDDASRTAGAMPGTLTNGPAAAAILAAGIGCFAVGLFALIGDAFHAAARFFTFYHPTGPLSGVTTSAIVVWLAAWYVLSRAWSSKSVALGRVMAISFVALALGILLTFPPFMDLLQGK